VFKWVFDEETNIPRCDWRVCRNCGHIFGTECCKEGTIDMLDKGEWEERNGEDGEVRLVCKYIRVGA
jgi:hypothetical protein